jgi:hypothetical protein
LLHLVKGIGRIQHKTTGDVKTSAMDNYLKLTNVGEYGKKQTLGLSVISCIQNFDEMGAYWDNNNISFDNKEIKPAHQE